MTGGFILRVFAKKVALVANASNEIINSIVSGIRLLYESQQANYRFAVSTALHRC